MTRHWTFGHKVGAGFAVAIALSVAIGTGAIYALRSVVQAKDRLIAVNAHLLIDAQRLHASVEKKGGAGRGFLLTRDERFAIEMKEARAELMAVMVQLKQNSESQEERRWLEAIVRSEADHQQAFDHVIA